MPARLPILLLSLTLAACTVQSPATRSPQSIPITLTPADATLWSQRIQTLLPSGWSVSTHENSLIAQRDQPLLWLGPDLNGPGFAIGDGSPAEMEAARREEEAYDKARARPYVFTAKFIFQPKLSIPEYTRLNAENVAFDRLRTQMKRNLRDIPHKFDSFLPDTPEQRARVEAYQKLKQSYHPLPDAYCDHYSVTISIPLREGGDRVYNNPEAAAEIQSVEQRLQSLFQPYPEPPHRMQELYGDP